MITILGNPSTLHVCNIVTRSIPLKAFLNHWNKAPCSFAAVLAAQKERPRELPVQINKPREIYGFCRFFIAQYSFPRRSTLSIGPLKASGSCIWWIVSTQKDKWTFVWPKHGKPIEWRIPPIFRYNRASVAHVCSCRHFCLPSHRLARYFEQKSLMPTKTQGWRQDLQLLAAWESDRHSPEIYPQFHSWLSAVFDQLLVRPAAW